jgi:hypothetical protein
MSAVHEDSEVSHGSVVDVDRVGVVYVWLYLYPSIMVDPWGGWVFRWNVSGYAFL